jgi:hypothetical protein
LRHVDRPGSRKQTGGFRSAEEDPENSRDFAVIQLMRVRGEVVGRVLDEKRVAEALDNDIELR